MKLMIVSIFITIALAVVAYLFTSSNNYFGPDFQEKDLWLSSTNPNLEHLSTFESLTKKIDLYDFVIDSEVDFANLQYEDVNLDYHSIVVPVNLVGKAIYSVKEIDGKKIVKLLSKAECIKAIAEWRTEYTFNIRREVTGTYTITSIYINEPI